VLQWVARAWGGKDGSVMGLWSALLAGAVSRNIIPAVPPGSDSARCHLARALVHPRREQRSRHPACRRAGAAFVILAAECRLMREDEADLTGRWVGLDRIAERR
jgi:hypothetical protein